MRDSEVDPTTIINRCNLDEYKLSITWIGNEKGIKRVSSIP